MAGTMRGADLFKTSNFGSPSIKKIMGSAKQGAGRVSTERSILSSAVPGRNSKRERNLSKRAHDVFLDGTDRDAHA